MNSRIRSSLSHLIALVVITFSLACSQQAKPWNVLLVTIDTTRADRIGCYGHADAHTPTLDSLAAEGFLFERCYSTNPITTPSHSSIMTGTYPMLHGVRDNGLFTLPDERTTLAEVFRAHGWATAAAVGSYPLTRRFGLDQGFDFFDDHIEAPYEDFRGDRIVTRQKLFFDERPAGDVNRAILPWLRSNAHKPFFAWVHYFDPHQPLQPPAPYDQLFAHDPYQGEIAYADESVGRLIEVLEETGVADRTLIVVMADHGEGLGDHDELTHSLLCYNTTIHIPLIMRIPGQEGEIRISEPVGSIDVAPTILDLMGFPAPNEIQGISLRSSLEADSDSPSTTSRKHYAETLSPQFSYGWSEVRVLFDGPFKYIHTSKPELFNLEADPFERNNLAGQRPELARSMLAEMESFIASKASPDSVAAAGDVDQETLNRLAALGYISGGPAPAPREVEEIRVDGVAPQDRAGDVSLWSSIKTLIFSKQYVEARELSQKLVNDDPENNFYLALLAQAQLKLGQIDDTLATLDRSPRLIPQVADLYLELARALIASGEYDRGIDIVTTVTDEHPSAKGFSILANLYKASGDRNEYRVTLQRALDLDSTYAPARVALAVDVANAGDLETAESELRRALADGPLYPPAHFNLGKLLLDTGRAEEALTRFQRAASLSPLYWNAYLGQIAGYTALGENGDAERVLRQMIARGAPEETRQQASAMVE